MKAIQTKYRGPMNGLGSRIVATCDGGRTIIPYDHNLEPADNHRAAADKLALSLGWGKHGPHALNWTTGTLKDGSYVHVCHYAGETWRTGDFSA
jgi:hypothetical protein